mgnify:FL=1
MELIVASLIIVFICCGCIIYYKLEFFEWTAICLDYRVGRSMTCYPEYVYELVENGETVTYKNRGFAVGFPRKGRKHRVLIKKKDHNKIVGYSEYITYKVLGTLMLFLFDKILCYSEMCDAYINALFKVIDEEENGKYYVCEKRENLIDVMRYMENLAQLRILGEKEYYAYIEKTGLIGGIVNAFNNIGQLKIDINNSIWDIRKCASRLGLKLSDKLGDSIE